MSGETTTTTAIPPSMPSNSETHPVVDYDKCMMATVTFPMLQYLVRVTGIPWFKMIHGEKIEGEMRTRLLLYVYNFSEGMWKQSNTSVQFSLMYKPYGSATGPEMADKLAQKWPEETPNVRYSVPRSIRHSLTKRNRMVVLQAAALFCERYRPTEHTVNDRGTIVEEKKAKGKKKKTIDRKLLFKTDKYPDKVLLSCMSVHKELGRLLYPMVIKTRNQKVDSDPHAGIRQQILSSSYVCPSHQSTAGGHHKLRGTLIFTKTYIPSLQCYIWNVWYGRKTVSRAGVRGKKVLTSSFYKHLPKELSSSSASSSQMSCSVYNGAAPTREPSPSDMVFSPSGYFYPSVFSELIHAKNYHIKTPAILNAFEMWASMSGIKTDRAKEHKLCHANASTYTAKCSLSLNARNSQFVALVHDLSKSLAIPVADIYMSVSTSHDKRSLSSSVKRQHLVHIVDWKPWPETKMTHIYQSVFLMCFVPWLSVAKNNERRTLAEAEQMLSTSGTCMTQLDKLSCAGTRVPLGVYYAKVWQQNGFRIHRTEMHSTEKGLRSSKELLQKLGSRAVCSSVVLYSPRDTAALAWKGTSISSLAKALVECISYVPGLSAAVSGFNRKDNFQKRLADTMAFYASSVGATSTSPLYSLEWSVFRVLFALTQREDYSVHPTRLLLNTVFGCRPLIDCRCLSDGISMHFDSKTEDWTTRKFTWLSERGGVVPVMAEPYPDRIVFHDVYDSQSQSECLSEHNYGASDYTNLVTRNSVVLVPLTCNRMSEPQFLQYARDHMIRYSVFGASMYTTSVEKKQFIDEKNNTATVLSGSEYETYTSSTDSTAWASLLLPPMPFNMAVAAWFIGAPIDTTTLLQVYFLLCLRTASITTSSILLCLFQLFCADCISMERVTPKQMEDEVVQLEQKGYALKSKFESVLYYDENTRSLYCCIEHIKAALKLPRNTRDCIYAYRYTHPFSITSFINARINHQNHVSNPQFAHHLCRSVHAFPKRHTKSQYTVACQSLMAHYGIHEYLSDGGYTKAFAAFKKDRSYIKLNECFRYCSTIKVVETAQEVSKKCTLSKLYDNQSK